MAGAEPRSRSDAPVLHWRLPARPETAVPGYRPAARADDDTRAKRTGRLRTQRGLFLWRLVAPGRTDHSLWAGRSRHRLCHRCPGRRAGGHVLARWPRTEEWLSCRRSPGERRRANMAPGRRWRATSPKAWWTGDGM